MQYENKALLARHFAEMWSLGDLLVADEIYHAAYVNHTPCSIAPVAGPEAEKRLVVLLRTALSGLDVTINALLAEGDRVVAYWTIQGIDSGGFLDRAPTWRAIRFSGVRIVRIQRGKIMESWDVVDRFELHAQLGLPIPAAVEEDAR